jgi:hypothetical protein
MVKHHKHKLFNYLNEMNNLGMSAEVGSTIFKTDATLDLKSERYEGVCLTFKTKPDDYVMEINFIPSPSLYIWPMNSAEALAWLQIKSIQYEHWKKAIRTQVTVNGNTIERGSKFLDLCLDFAMNGIDKAHKKLRTAAGPSTILDIYALLQDNNIFPSSIKEVFLLDGDSPHWLEMQAKRPFKISTLTNFFPASMNFPFVKPAVSDGAASRPASGAALGGPISQIISQLPLPTEAAAIKGGPISQIISQLPLPTKAAAIGGPISQIISQLPLPTEAVQSIIQNAPLRKPLPDIPSIFLEYDPGEVSNADKHDAIAKKGIVPDNATLINLLYENRMRPSG